MRLTKFETTYLLLEPFLSVQNFFVRRKLLALCNNINVETPKILDVGGRKSHYTIGVPGEVTISDLPRKFEVQHALNLGITEDIKNQTISRRSNVVKIIYDDMTHSKIASSTFNIVSAVEVLEHVEEDDLFVNEVFRVLRPGGVFLLTTPNGDYVRNTNPDHKRHYTHNQLYNLLASAFDSVSIEYTVKIGRFRTLGLKSWSIRHPLRTLLSMAGNLINLFQSMNKDLASQSNGTSKLICCATKRA
jgi:SAM-dependent methyltransferase